MARINDLIRQLEAKDPALAAEISREVRALSERRAFGLSFERHTPEQVELPGRPVRRGDKVHILPPRGQFPKNENRRIWLVDSMSPGKKKVANLIAQNDPDHTSEVTIEDLVVVAEFRDPIYPGLVSTGKVERGGDKPFHSVINGENFHALEALLYTHRGKVDAIYIDPPYNSGARDWKYNNDYVESDDIYRHSKWLAFIERRLLLARELLNPDDSALIVTIDEKEYLRLGLLLEQLFPDASIEMVTSVISAKGVARAGQFSRVEEFIFFVRFGGQQVGLSETNMLDSSRNASDKIGQSVDWLGLRRREPTARRGARPRQFYPIYVHVETGRLVSIGDPIGDGIDRSSVGAPDQTIAIWPLLPNGAEGLWGITPDTARTYLDDGFLRARNFDPRAKTASIQYLPSGTVARVKSGDIQVIGRDSDNSIVAVHLSAKGVIPKRVWNLASHNAETHGTNLIRDFLPVGRFPYPKSLYAVEDTLRFVVGDKPDATVVDFFAGSGTTAHAVMRLNRQDGGRRHSISVTNNEVGADEQKELVEKGLRAGDPDWDKLGICDHITKPRIRAALTGRTSDGKEIKGDYKFTDNFPMADGFEENVEFFTLTYEALLQVASGRAFERIAPLLWLRAGSIGRRIDSARNGWDVADAYGVLTDLDKSEEFASTISKATSVTHAFVFTDEDRLFETVTRMIPSHVEVVRMNDAYLRNAEIEAPAVAR